ncbi:MAG: GNAT family N-acetyltransferase [Candidatus Lokiarchaeota archaeon]|nr:GNAT family N-acetyltransferase [Candidatus Lokiarchaeota archaeon]
MKIEKFSMKFYEEVIQLWKNAGISVGSSDSKNEIERMLNRNPDLFLIGKIKDQIISVVMGGFDGRRGYVHHLAVDPTFQKKGYGRKIMNRLNEIFHQKGVHKVHLFIERHNKEVVDFYQNLGWEIRKDLTMMSYIPDEKRYKKKL